MKHKKRFRICCGTKLKRKNIEKSHVIFQFYWRQKQQQAEAHYIEYTQLYEDNQLEEKHPGVCDEELEERSEIFFRSLANDDVKKIKQRI